MKTNKKIIRDCKPCPFCGHKAEGFEILSAGYIRCSNYDCPVLPEFPKEPMLESIPFDECVTNWNTRSE